MKAPAHPVALLLVADRAARRPADLLKLADLCGTPSCVPWVVLAGPAPELLYPDGRHAAFPAAGVDAGPYCVRPEGAPAPPPPSLALLVALSPRYLWCRDAAPLGRPPGQSAADARRASPAAAWVVSASSPVGFFLPGRPDSRAGVQSCGVCSLGHEDLPGARQALALSPSGTATLFHW